jgi:hypothetical protein
MDQHLSHDKLHSVSQADKFRIFCSRSPFQYPISIISREPGQLSKYNDKATGWATENRGLIPNRDRDMYLLTSSRPESGTHPSSYAAGICGSFPRGKLPRRETDCSPPLNAKVKMHEATPSLLYSSTRLNGVMYD